MSSTPNQLPNVAQLSGEDYPNVLTIGVDGAYWQGQSDDQLVWGYFCLEIIRQFEQALLEETITPARPRTDSQ